MKKKIKNESSVRGAAFDTSGHALVCALIHGSKRVQTRSAGLAYHSEKLFQTLDAGARRLQLDLSRLDFVAVGIGPGSFTGIRVGVTAAKTLSYASGASLIGISSLELVAANLACERRAICVVQDARRSRLFTATFRDGRELKAPALVNTGDFLFGLEKDTLYTGDAVGLFADTLSRKFGRGAVVRDRRKWFPNPAVLMDLALERWRAKKTSDPLTLIPEYLYEDTCNVTVEKPRQLRRD
jgi:tRNA threonylcarbamoyladenosine biosynthesis protein TsaB